MSSAHSADSDAIHYVQPLEDARWGELLESHPRASIFHTAAWLNALRLTYGYEPRVLTTSPPGQPLKNGIVLCRVDSWLTGRRLVSVPSSDHCEVLVEDSDDRLSLFSGIERALRKEGLKYVDFHTDVDFPTSLFRSTNAFCFHELDLTPNLSTLLKNCHKNSIQRKIRRAAREGLTYERGRSEEILNTFLGLYAITRRRHQLPPQPEKWFRNLIKCFGPSLTIRLACKNNQPVAANLTIGYKDSLVYKYGCSDARYHNLGGTPLLFWKMIEEGKNEGARALDLGRSDLQNTGLITFKDRLGAAKSTLVHSRFAVSQNPIAIDTLTSRPWTRALDRHLLTRLPDQALYFVGYLLYPHAG
jgi:CelD/BcsL family acetyltransferase involved in cellulose biosynthesis